MNYGKGVIIRMQRKVGGRKKKERGEAKNTELKE